MKNIFAFLFAITLIASFGITVLAQGDLTPPTFVDIDVQPPIIDTSKSSQVVTITAIISDDLSGVEWATFAFVPSVGGTQNLIGSFSPGNIITTTELGNHYLITRTVPQFAAEGMWTLNSGAATDKVGNFVNFDNEGFDSENRAFNIFRYFLNRADLAADPGKISEFELKWLYLPSVSD